MHHKPGRIRKVLLWGSMVATIVLLYFVSPLDGLFPLRYEEESRPIGLGSVILLTDNTSIAGTSVWVYVRDDQTSNPLLVGGNYASDSDVHMRHATWSNDGSVVAIRVTYPADRETIPGDKDSYYAVAYDFRDHKIIQPEASYAMRSPQIETLLINRGGAGKAIFEMPYGALGKPMPSWKRRQFGH